MCGRFSLSSPVAVKKFLHDFGFSDLPEDAIYPRYNIAPTQSILCLRGINQHVEMCYMRWGLIPPWTKKEEISSKYINARAETVGNKPMFKNLFKSRRCLILADGFYEWQLTKSGKQPYHVRVEEQPVFAIAGIWTRWGHAKEEPIDSCAIIVTDANETMARVHDRMPVILSPDDYGLWLDSEFGDADVLKNILKPLTGSKKTLVAVSPKVNNPRYDNADCLVPLSKSSDVS